MHTHTAWRALHSSVSLSTFSNEYALEMYISYGHVSQSNRNQNWNWILIELFIFIWFCVSRNFHQSKPKKLLLCPRVCNFKCQMIKRKIRIFVLIVQFLSNVCRIQFYADCELGILVSYCFKFSILEILNAQYVPTFRHMNVCSVSTVLADYNIILVVGGHCYY